MATIRRFHCISGTSSWTKVLSRGSAVPAVHDSADHEMLEHRIRSYRSTFSVAVPMDDSSGQKCVRF